LPDLHHQLGLDGEQSLWPTYTSPALRAQLAQPQPSVSRSCIILVRTSIRSVYPPIVSAFHACCRILDRTFVWGRRLQKRVSDEDISGRTMMKCRFDAYSLESFSLSLFVWSSPIYEPCGPLGRWPRSQVDEVATEHISFVTAMQKFVCDRAPRFPAARSRLGQNARSVSGRWI